MLANRAYVAALVLGSHIIVLLALFPTNGPRAAAEPVLTILPSFTIAEPQPALEQVAPVANVAVPATLAEAVKAPSQHAKPDSAISNPNTFFSNAGEVLPANPPNESFDCLCEVALVVEPPTCARCSNEADDPE